MSKKYNTRRPAVFLDRDGTINYDYGYVHQFSNFKFKPHVIKGLKYLAKRKYLIFIVTNQAGLAKGKFKLSDLLSLHKKLTVSETSLSVPCRPRGIILLNKFVNFLFLL